MGKKKPEMSQIYNSSNNEFIFGENGGRGKHLSSFLKNLSLTGSPTSSSQRLVSTPAKDSFKEVNSSIYGSFSYGHASPKGAASGPSSDKRTVSGGGDHVGASFSHITSTTSPSDTAHKNSPYLNNGPQRTGSSINIRPNHRRTTSHTRHVKYTDLDDDWAADLDEIKPPMNKRISSLSNESKSSLQPSPMVDSLHPDLTIPVTTPVVNKDSMDYDDYQMKLEISKLNQLNSKYTKFKKVLTEDNSINIQDLRKLSWNGIPTELRAISWQILLGYLPTNKSRQASTLKRKRQEYLDGLDAVDDEISINSSSVSVDTTSNNNNNSLNRDKQLYHQIKIDVKRTNPTVKLYSYDQTQKSLRKILYLWAVRHPASGYVQGINDLCTPFYQIFLSNYIWQLQQSKISNDDEAKEDASLFIPGLMDSEDTEEQQLLNDPKLSTLTIDNLDPSRLSQRVTSIIEADTYWCLSRLLENITDNYIHEQPGIIRQVGELRNLISKIDIDLLQHFDKEGIELMQFAFRWMNCLLMRELSINLIIRMWDTYLSETPLGFNNFHVYVCAAFLIKFSNELKEKDFQEILLFLQNPPTTGWKEKDIELMLSEAFIWQSLYKNASAHLR